MSLTFDPKIEAVHLSLQLQLVVKLAKFPSMVCKTLCSQTLTIHYAWTHRQLKNRMPSVVNHQQRHRNGYQSN